MRLRNQFIVLLVVVLAIYLANRSATHPNPNPDPTPTPGGNIRVAFVIESSESMPQEVIDEFSSADGRKYMNDHAAKENGQPAYRVFDKDTDVAHESAYWQKVLAEPRKSTPWLYIDPDGLRRSYSAEPPKTVPEFMTLLKKYGGA